MSTPYKVYWSALALFVVVFVGYMQYLNAQREREREEVLRRIEQEGPKSHAELFPDSLVHRWIDTKELPDVTIGGKKLVTRIDAPVR